MVEKIGIADINAYPPADGSLPFLFQIGVAADGTFEFPRVPPGSYKLSPVPVITAWTPISFSVSDSDITGLDLIVPLEARATVRLTVDENIALPPVSISFAGPYGGRPAGSGMVATLPPGPFPARILYAAIPAGEHRVIVSGLPAPYFVKSIMSGTKDLLRDPLTIDSSSPIEVVVTLALPPGTGVRVAGRVVNPSGVPMPPSPAVSLHIPMTGTSMSTPINPDGSFEFRRVPRGSYEATLAGSSSLLYEPKSILVAENELTGVEIVVPRRIQVRGKVTVEGGGPLPKPLLLMERPNNNSVLGVQEDGTFEALLPEGEYRLDIRELPEGYFVKSATYGAVDAVTQPLRLGSTTSDILITLASRVPAPWKKVSGRVAGATAASPANIQLLGNRGSFFARTRADGTFEIPEVLPGTYRVLTGSYNLPQPTIVVADKDVTGVELIHRPFARFRGRMIVEGGGPAARFELRFAGTGFAPGALSLIELEENGSFTVSLPEEEISLAATSFPPSYTLKSITYGGKDALNGNVRFSSSDRQEIVVTFSPASSPAPWRKVSGRVVRESPSGIKAARVTMIASAGIYYQAPVATDGSFEFPTLLPGLYERLSAVPYFGASATNQTVRVADEDVSGIEVRYPELFEISGRTVMMEGTAVPEDPRWYVNNVYLKRTFKLLVRRGENKISFANSGSNYKIASAVYAGIDLLKEPLQFAAPPAEEIVVTLSPAEFSRSSGGIALRGRVTGDLSAIPMPRRVSLYNDDQQERKYVETSLSDDGSFEFINVPPGRFIVMPVGVPYAATIIARPVVRDRDINDLNVAIFHSVESAVQVAMDDGSPLPEWAGLRLSSARSSEPLGLEIPANGRFQWAVSEDEQFLSVRALPTEFLVKSMTYGSVDLLKSSLKLDPTAAPAEIRITIGRSR